MKSSDNAALEFLSVLTKGGMEPEVSSHIKLKKYYKKFDEFHHILERNRPEDTYPPAVVFRPI